MENIIYNYDINEIQNRIASNSLDKFDPSKINRRIKGIKVLMYHRIIGDNQQQRKRHWTTVSEEDFEKQLLLLDHFGYTTITFRDFRLYLLDELDLPKKPIILTFDDGYSDFHEYAFPLLNKYGMKAVLFAMGNRSLAANTWETSDAIKTAALLSDEQLLELNYHNFEIGAHTMNHPKLTELDDEDKLIYEICQSKISLEELLDETVYTFCYPYGLQNKRIRELVRQAGYKFACSVYTGPHHFGTSFYNIRRITIANGTGILGFAFKVLTPNEYWKWITNLKNKLEFA